MSVTGSRCGDCDQVFVPPRGRCSHCGGATGEVQVGDEGVLRSWTVVRRAPEGFDPPYTVGIVELEDGVLAVARGAEAASVLDVGSEVVVEEAGDGSLRFQASPA